MSNSTPETLDKLLRARALEELTSEVKRTFEPISKYFGHNNERNRLLIPVENHSMIIAVRTDPKDLSQKVYAIDVPQMLQILKQKAIENYSLDRGDKQVAAFMERVESLGQEIDTLRSHVEQTLD